MKELIKELRLLVAEILIATAFKIMPKGVERTALNIWAATVDIYKERKVE
jgi:hypothetical protein